MQELSAPLTAIVSNAQAAQRMDGVAGTDSEMLDVLAYIAEDGKRAGELLRSLAALLKREAENEEAVDSD